MDKEEEIARLREALEHCRQYVRDVHFANGGWWNYHRAYELIRNHIDPALGTHTR